MLKFNTNPKKVVQLDNKKEVFVFDSEDDNLDQVTVDSFGEEWSKFNYFDSGEIENIGNEYFDIIDFSKFNKDATVLDVGCGTGRWSVYLSSKVSNIYAMDPSKAIYSAANLTKDIPNIHLIKASVENIPYEDNTFDLVISLGVLHHIPDTQKALNSIVKKVKKEGHCLIYLYYALDNRSVVYKMIFYASSFFRYFISKLPSFLKKSTCDIIAISVYMPFIYLSKLVKFLFGKKWGSKIPLSYYSNKSFNVIRNDALDRFGTPLEQRFSKVQIEEMMRKSGLKDITFSEKQPYWHVIGRK
jgi:ubiquinone/menaquinone biosynthesis C-methylase UbiE